jgi:hypothetical protein
MNGSYNGCLQPDIVVGSRFIRRKDDMDQYAANGEGGIESVQQKVTGKTVIYTCIGIAIFFCITLVIVMILSYNFVERPILQLEFDYIGQDTNNINSTSLSLEEGEYYCVLTVSGSPKETVTLRILDKDGTLQWEGVTEESTSDFNASLDPHAVLTISYDGLSDPEAITKHISIVCYAR